MSSLYEEQQARMAAKRRKYQAAARDLAEHLADVDGDPEMADVEQWIREMGGYES